MSDLDGSPVTTTGADDRRLVLVAGAGRSGTSLMTGILAKLGMSVPQPEISADETNPRGFSEPRWVVDFHVRLMRTRRLTSLDGRPSAIEMAAAAAVDADIAGTLRSWLEVQFVGADQVVVKDPRIVWFLPLWQQCARDLGIDTNIVTMLRYPTEVIASARTWYGDWQSDPSRACGWINVMLETERISRDLPRAYVCYSDLLTGWQAEIERVGATLAIPSLAAVDPVAAKDVDSFVDPGLHRQTVGWEGMGVPERVQELSEQVWNGLVGFSHAEGAPSPEQLDSWRERYVRLYTEAEQVAQSTIRAASKGSADATGSKAAKPKQLGAASRKPKPRGPRGALRRVSGSSVRLARSNRLVRTLAVRLRNQPAARAAYRRLQRLLGS
jgi:hypothetical protein